MTVGMVIGLIMMVWITAAFNKAHRDLTGVNMPSRSAARGLRRRARKKGISYEQAYDKWVERKQNLQREVKVSALDRPGQASLTGCVRAVAQTRFSREGTDLRWTPVAPSRRRMVDLSYKGISYRISSDGTVESRSPGLEKRHWPNLSAFSVWADAN